MRANPAVGLIGFEPRFARTLGNVLERSNLLQAIHIDRPIVESGEVIESTGLDAAVVCWEATHVGHLYRLTHAHPATGFVVLARTLSAAQATALVRCGAAAAVARTAGRHLVIGATLLAAKGLSLETAEPRHPPGRLAKCVDGRTALSTRETEVLGLLECGESLPRIAELFGVSVQTVKAQTRSIYRKIGVHNRAELREHARAQQQAIHRLPTRSVGGQMRVDFSLRCRSRIEHPWLRSPLSRLAVG